MEEEKVIYKIEHLGKTYATATKPQEISDEYLKNLKEEFFRKPSMADVRKQFEKIKLAGGKVNNYINRRYFFDLMCNTKMYITRWSVNEAFQSKDVIGYFLSRFKMNEKVFNPNRRVTTNLMTAFRLGGAGVAKIPSNFPIWTAYEIIDKYNVNNKWYDFSCGWGVRLLAALSKDVDYYGTDPNYLLTERLDSFQKDWKNHFSEIGVRCDSVVDIRTQGSEVFVPEWENKIGLAFSSPPYFSLEDYRIGKQSFTEGKTSYDDWLQFYLKPTLQNIKRYLIPEGNLVLNINKFDKYDLVGDTIKTAEDVGFKYVGHETLINIKRINPKREYNDNSEKCLCFKKSILEDGA